MNYDLKKLISAATLLCSALVVADGSSSCSTCPTSCGQGQNTFQPHAFSASMGREVLVGKHAWIPMSNEEGWHGQVAVAGEYQKSLHNTCNTKYSCCTSLGSLPFWSDDNSNFMTVGDNSGTYNLDLYQIGMGPVTTNGTISLNPTVYQAGADFFLYVGAQKTERGFFLKAHGPVGVFGMNPRFISPDEDTVAPVAYPAGALNNTAATTVAAPYNDVASAFQGDKGTGFLKPMIKGLINGCRTSSAKFGDPEFTLGYNVYADEVKHLGIGLRFSAPTGNKPEGTYILEPIFGRAGHWGAGGEIIGHWRFWESDTDDRYIQVTFDADILHLFNAQFLRSFDLKKNGAGSKYLLLARYSGTAFQSEITNAINITTIGVNSSFAIEGNFAAVVDFHWSNWSMALGYEGWGRTCEKLSIDCACPGSVNFNDYAVLGRQTPYTTGGVALNLSEPLATISKSQARATTATATIVDATVATNRIPDQAKEALDIDGQVARSAYTSKPFAQIQYTWRDSDYNPYIGVSGGAELSQGNTKNAAVSFWNVGVQGGLAF